MGRNEEWRTVFSGAFANVTECTIMHPLDSLKTRQQLAVGSQRLTLWNGFSSLRRGGLKEVYRGLLPAVGMQAPRGVIKFVSNSTALGTLTKAGEKPKTIQAVGAGFCAGAFESFFINPFELAKVRMQSAENLGRYRNSLDLVAKVVRSEGLGALYTGLEATLLRNGMWNAAYFGGIHVQRDFVSSKQWDQGPSLTFTQGMLAGMFGSCFSNPVDVCKSRIQTQPFTDGRPTLVHLFRMLVSIVRYEGIGGLYLGFTAKLLRLGPGGGILLLAFETGGNIFDQLF